MWAQLVSKAFGLLKLEGAKTLIHQLESFAKPYLVKETALTVGAVLLEGIDAVIAAAVNSLDKESAGTFAHAYVEEIDHEIAGLTEAFHTYIPLQFAVEEARKEFGSGSQQEKDALTARDADIASIKDDMGALFQELFKIA